jgi:ADP-ribose pyrophosphatase
MRDHGPWKILASREMYADRYVQVELDQVIRPDKQPGQHVVVQMKAGVCVLPLDERGWVYLTSEFHYAIGRISLEAVSGGIEPGEDPLETARRELQEELGLVATHWHPLVRLDPYTTIIRSPVQLYLATGLAPAPAAPEGTELIETVCLPLAEAIQRIHSGELTHAPTCVALLMAAAIGSTKEAV